LAGASVYSGTSLSERPAHAQALDKEARARHEPQFEQIAPADAGLNELLPIFQYIQLTLGETIFKQTHLSSPLTPAICRFLPAGFCCEVELTTFPLFYSTFLYRKHNQKKLSFERAAKKNI
jgi:hypothetical protein